MSLKKCYISNSGCVLDYPAVSKKATTVSAVEVADNVISKKGTMRIAARQQLLHTSAVITAVMNLMGKKLWLKSGCYLKEEDINFDTNMLSESLRQLLALDDDPNTVKQMKAFAAKLDAGMAMSSLTF